MGDRSSMGKIRALILDVDGTIAETERDGHRVAFNRAFAAKGLHSWVWDVQPFRCKRPVKRHPMTISLRFCDRPIHIQNQRPNLAHTRPIAPSHHLKLYWKITRSVYPSQ